MFQVVLLVNNCTTQRPRTLALALLQENPKADDRAIREALQFNLCRCGTHMRILQAIHRAGELMQQAGAAPSNPGAG